jgi:hypothetical protein
LFQVPRSLLQRRLKTGDILGQSRPLKTTPLATRVLHFRQASVQLSLKQAEFPAWNENHDLRVIPARHVGYVQKLKK